MLRIISLFNLKHWSKNYDRCMYSIVLRNKLSFSGNQTHTCSEKKQTHDVTFSKELCKSEKEKKFVVETIKNASVFQYSSQCWFIHLSNCLML